MQARLEQLRQQHRDLDAAIDFASRIPGARHGSVEIRPLVDGP